MVVSTKNLAPVTKDRTLDCDELDSDSSDDHVDYVEHDIVPYVEFKLAMRQLSTSMCFFEHLTIQNFYRLWNFVAIVHDVDACWNGCCDCWDTWNLNCEHVSVEEYSTLDEWFQDHRVDIWSIYRGYFMGMLPYSHFVYLVWDMSHCACRDVCSTEDDMNLSSIGPNVDFVIDERDLGGPFGTLARS